MIKITNNLIKDIIKNNYNTDDDKKILKIFIQKNLLKSIIIKENNLVLKAIEYLNKIEA